MAKNVRNERVLTYHPREVLSEVLEAVFGIKPAKEHVRWIDQVREALAQQLQLILAVSLAGLTLGEGLFAEVRAHDLHSTHPQPRRA